MQHEDNCFSTSGEQNQFAFGAFSSTNKPICRSDVKKSALTSAQQPFSNGKRRCVDRENDGFFVVQSTTLVCDTELLQHSASRSAEAVDGADLSSDSASHSSNILDEEEIATSLAVTIDPYKCSDCWKAVVDKCDCISVILATLHDTSKSNATDY